MRKQIFRVLLVTLSILAIISCGDDANENAQIRYASSYIDDNNGLITINEYAFIYDITYDIFSENITGMTETISCTLFNPTDDDGNPINNKIFVEQLFEDFEPDDYTISWKGDLAVITYNEQIFSIFENRQTVKMLYYESRNDGGSMWANIHDLQKRNYNDHQDYNDDGSSHDKESFIN